MCVYTYACNRSYLQNITKELNVWRLQRHTVSHGLASKGRFKKTSLCG